MDIEVWTTKQDCWTCGEPTVIWYPPAVGSYAGGTWEPVGEALSKEPDSPIGRTYSDVQETHVWGNLCEECGQYQGNYYVHRDAQEFAYEHGKQAMLQGEVTEYDVIHVDVDVHCEGCGADEVELPTAYCDECLDGNPPPNPYRLLD